MSILGPVIEAIGGYDRFVDEQVRRTRDDAAFREELLRKWRALRDGVAAVTTPTGLTLPRLALPQTDEPAEVARYLYAEGPPGEFPFVNGAYREMYLEHSGDGIEAVQVGSASADRLL